MGLTYTAILQDGFDWAYIGTSKKKYLEKIQASFEALNRAKPELLGEWYGFMVLDFDKTSVWIEEYADIILKNCDTAHYWNNENPYEIKKLKQGKDIFDK